MDLLVLQIFHHPNSLKHDMGEQHLEAPIRIEIIQEQLKKASYKTKFIEVSPASEEDITNVHANSLLQTVKESSLQENINNPNNAILILYIIFFIALKI